MKTIRGAAGLAILCTVAAIPALVLHYAASLPVDLAKYLETETSPTLVDRSGELLYAYLRDDDHWSFPQSLDAISPLLLQATVAVEDQRFHGHRGVDPFAVARAAWGNLWSGEVVSGASTLTMQLVKLGGVDEGGVRGKVSQAILAMRLEQRTSKETLLEAYLNRAPYGYNLIGAEAASRRYFGKSATELTLAEAALLAGLPKAPGNYQPLEHPAEATRRRNHVLRRMFEEGFIDDEAYTRARNQPLGAAWHAFPKHAPHLAMELDGEGRFEATLDAGAQRYVERLLPHYLKQFDGEITNAAVIVADVETGSVRAYAGSAGFYGIPGGGQVDICRAPRSPGSALKPFAYALALERNQLYPSEKLLDDRIDYGTYSPENFDGGYYGLVSASDALQASLNVPAVKVLERVGVGEFYASLKELGFTTLEQPPSHYGLGLVLGNCEVTLFELVQAYCGLAKGGVFGPLRVLANTTPQEETRRFARGTSLAIYNMLEADLPSEHGDLVRAKGGAPRVAWKTGTSTGYHDAWSVAFNRQYVVGVWLGNNDGRPCHRLVGAEAALPLAKVIFRRLEPANSPVWPDTVDALRSVRVCAASGLPKSSYCQATRAAQFPRNQYLNRRCDVHRRSPEGSGVIARWPGSARTWDLADVGPRQPAGNERKEQVAFRITHPSDGAEFVYTGRKKSDSVRLQTSADAAAIRHWYVDDRYAGASKAGETKVLRLSPGRHALTCMTAEGEVDRIEYEVLDGARGASLDQAD